MGKTPNDLDTRQRDLLEFIRRYLASHDHAPTFTAMGKAIGVCRQRAQVLCWALQHHGLLTITRGHNHAITLNERRRVMVTIPLARYKRLLAIEKAAARFTKDMGAHV